MFDLSSMTRKFVLGEGHNPPSLRSYIQSLSETIRAFSPKTQTEKRRVEIALEHIREIKRHTRKLEERVNILEEQINILEEGKD